MATTTNYAWETPDDTDLVKDGAAAIRTLGSSIDTTTKALNPSTTLGDIEYRSSTANTNTRLGIGTTGQVLTVSGGVPAWTTASSGALTKITSATFSGVANTGTTFDGVFSSTYNNYKIVMSNITGTVSSANFQFQLRIAGPSTQASAYYGARLANGTATTYSNSSSFVLQLLETEAAHVNMLLARDAGPTQWSYTGFQRPSVQTISGGGMNDSVGANAATGFILSASSGNISGFVAVYGLAD